MCIFKINKSAFLLSELYIYLQHLSETFLILRNHRDMNKNVCRSSCKVSYSCQILMKLEFSTNNQTSNFTKIHLVVAELFHAKGRTDGLTYRQT
jgi:hypothetical protein